MTAWVSVEGVNGVGKTWFVRQLAASLGPLAMVLDELTDAPDSTAEVVIAAMLAAGGTFLRTGHPLAETFALSALKVREFERIQALPEPPAVVVEDRGVDTVAVYQAAILCGPDADLATVAAVADRVAAISAGWRPAADLVVLLVDDLDACIDRFERRSYPIGAADRQLLDQVDALYRHRAAADPTRWRICPVAGRPAHAVVDEVAAWCQDLVAADQRADVTQ